MLSNVVAQVSLGRTRRQRVSLNDCITEMIFEIARAFGSLLRVLLAIQFFRDKLQVILDCLAGFELEGSAV